MTRPFASRECWYSPRNIADAPPVSIRCGDCHSPFHHQAPPYDTIHHSVNPLLPHQPHEPPRSPRHSHRARRPPCRSGSAGTDLRPVPKRPMMDMWRTCRPCPLISPRTPRPRASGVADARPMPGRAKPRSPESASTDQHAHERAASRDATDARSKSRRSGSCMPVSSRPSARRTAVSAPPPRDARITSARQEATALHELGFESFADVRRGARRRPQPPRWRPGVRRARARNRGRDHRPHPRAAGRARHRARRRSRWRPRKAIPRRRRERRRDAARRRRHGRRHLRHRLRSRSSNIPTPSDTLIPGSSIPGAGFGRASDAGAGAGPRGRNRTGWHRRGRPRPKSRRPKSLLSTVAAGPTSRRSTSRRVDIPPVEVPSGEATSDTDTVDHEAVELAHALPSAGTRSSSRSAPSSRPQAKRTAPPSARRTRPAASSRRCATISSSHAKEARTAAAEIAQRTSERDDADARLEELTTQMTTLREASGRRCARMPKRNSATRDDVAARLSTAEGERARVEAELEGSADVGERGRGERDPVVGTRRGARADRCRTLGGRGGAGSARQRATGARRRSRSGHRRARHDAARTRTQLAGATTRVEELETSLAERENTLTAATARVDELERTVETRTTQHDETARSSTRHAAGSTELEARLAHQESEWERLGDDRQGVLQRARSGARAKLPSSRRRSGRPATKRDDDQRTSWSRPRACGRARTAFGRPARADHGR